MQLCALALLRRGRFKQCPYSSLNETVAEPFCLGGRASVMWTCCVSNVLEVGKGILTQAVHTKAPGSYAAAGCPRGRGWHTGFMIGRKEEQRVPWCPAASPAACLEGTQGSCEGGSFSHFFSYRNCSL